MALLFHAADVFRINALLKCHIQHLHTDHNQIPVTSNGKGNSGITVNNTYNQCALRWSDNLIVDSVCQFH